MQGSRIFAKRLPNLPIHEACIVVSSHEQALVLLLVKLAKKNHSVEKTIQQRCTSKNLGVEALQDAVGKEQPIALPALVCVLHLV